MDNSITYKIPIYYITTILYGDTTALSTREESKVNHFLEKIGEGEKGKLVFPENIVADEKYFSIDNDVTGNVGAEVVDAKFVTY
jgi:hypothetical protein